MALIAPLVTVGSKIVNALGPTAQVELKHMGTEYWQEEGEYGVVDGHRFIIGVESRGRGFTVKSVHLTNLGEDRERLRVLVTTADGEKSSRLEPNGRAEFVIEEVIMGGVGATTPHPCLRGPWLVEVEIAGRRTIVKQFHLPTKRTR